MKPKPMPRVGVLLTNNVVPLLFSQETIKAVRRRHPDAEIVTAAPSNSPVLSLLRADPSIDRVIIVPGTDPLSRISIRKLRTFLASVEIGTTYVLFHGASSGEYMRLVQASLACPGRVYLWRVGKSPLPIRHPSSLMRLASTRIKLAMSATLRSAQAALSRAPARVHRKDVGDPKRILWMPMDGLGDLIITLPALLALADRYPDAQIDVVVREAHAQLLRDLVPTVNLVLLELPGTPVRTRPSANTCEMMRLIVELRKNHYDVAVDVSGLDTFRKLAYLSGAWVRVGPQRSHRDDPERANWSVLLTHPLKDPDPRAHTFEIAADVVESLGARRPTIDLYRNRIGLHGHDEAVDRLLSGLGVAGRFAVIQACSIVSIRNWRLDGFADVIDHLVERHHLSVLLTGGPSDREYNTRVLSRVTRQGLVRDVAGMLPLSALGALFSRAEIMVSVDTGPMHIAAAVRTPIVALFLPGAEHLFYPYGQRHAVLTPTCEELRKWMALETSDVDNIVAHISTERVIRAVDATLASHGRSSDDDAIASSTCG
jgi:ADP-heptose:LPS heptosyltransferase